MQNPLPGTIVEARGQAWRLLDRQPFERCALVTLRGLDRGNVGETLRILTPFDRLTVHRRDRRLRAAGRFAVARTVADAVLDAHPWFSCSTAVTANIDLLPWQIEPVLAVLGGATRVLLADAVGLGKTVQAALILAELSARMLVDRTLILTPAGLRSQWAEELAARFNLHASILDQPALAREATSLPADINPWAMSPIVISSIDLVKRPETLVGVERVPFDLLIVDEAHHLTPDSDRGHVVARLAQRTPWVVLISATPHSGDDRAFAFLRDIGSTSADQLTIFRRVAPIHDLRPRSRLVNVTVSDAERALLDAVSHYSSAIWSAQGVTSQAARLVAILLARRAGSSADAILASLVRRRALLGSTQETPVDQPSLPWEEIDGRDGDEADTVLATPGLSSIEGEHGVLDRLIALAHQARERSTKLRWIARFITRAREPVIVFSEYRDSMEALRVRLESLVSVAVLHGGLSPAMRRLAVSAFVDGSAMVLLATDAAGEGLNLQARCRTVINLELPWNPLRLDQRIGRVDRIGQRRRVHAIHLLHAGSIEDSVLAHLYRRAARAATMFTPAGGSAIDIEARVAETIFAGAAAPTLVVSNVSREPTPAATDEVQRLEMLRRLATTLDRSPFEGRRLSATDIVPVGVPRRSAGAITHLLAVLRMAFIDDVGRNVITSIVPITIEPWAALPENAVDAVASITELGSFQAAVRASAENLLQPSQVGMRDFARSADSRTRELIAALERDGESLYQPALFDARSTHAATEHAAVRIAHREHLERTREVVRGLGAVAIQPPTLVGVWLS